MTVETAYSAFYAHTNHCEQCERARPKRNWRPEHYAQSVETACLDGRVLLRKWREAVLEACLEWST